MLRTSPIDLHLWHQSDDAGRRSDRVPGMQRVRRGVYADAAEWQALTPWDRYLARVHAQVLYDPRSVIVDESAAALWGPSIAWASRPVHVLRPGGHARSSAALRIHTTRDTRDIVEVDGILLTSPTSTAIDLARSRPWAEGRAYADALMRIDPGISSAALSAENASRSSSRGALHAGWAIDRASPIPESVLESLSLCSIEWNGFEMPTLQVEFPWELGIDRSDFCWIAQRVIGEADGDAKYDLAEDPRQALRDEKQREDRLRRQAAGFARWGWDDLGVPGRIASLLVAAGLEPIDRPDPVLLATLRRIGR
ncbi:MAG: hypothetical protein ACTHW5_09470 [Microbacterium sp.]